VDLARAREAVAQEYGFALFRFYDERIAAGLIGVHYSTLKRWRSAGRVPFVARGSGIRYMGYQIADFLLLGNEAACLGHSRGDLPAVGNKPDANPTAPDNASTSTVASNASALARSIVLRRR
jgi:hypothetical protein